MRSVGDFDEEGGFESANYDLVVSAVGNREENKKEGDEIDEEEKQYLLEVMD